MHQHETSILPDRQQHQRTGYFYFDAFGAQHRIEFWVFGARIEDDALGSQPNDIIVIFLLPHRIEIQRYGIDARERLRRAVDFNARNGFFLQADGFYRMARADQPVERQIRIAGRISGCAHDERFLLFHMIAFGDVNVTRMS